MANSKIKLALVGGALALGLSSGAFAEDIATAKMLADTCAGCHGTNGNSVGPASPSISAMDPVVFVDTMIAFQSGDTYSTIMGRIAKGYTEEEFEDGRVLPQAGVRARDKQEFDQAMVDEGRQAARQVLREVPHRGRQAGARRRGLLHPRRPVDALPEVRHERLPEDRRILPKKMGKKLDAMLEDKGEDSLQALYAFYAAYTDFSSPAAATTTTTTENDKD
jgi:sulfide dehydrogenase cytochrome subunit